MIIKIGNLYFEHVEGDQVSLTFDRKQAHRFPDMETVAPRAAWLADHLGIEHSMLTIEG